MPLRLHGAGLYLFLLFVLFSAPLLSQDTRTKEEIPWTGELGVTETVDQIMARQALMPAEQPLRKGWKPKRVRPDRSALPQNPASPAVSAWPEERKSYAPPVESPQTLGVSFTGATLSGTNPTFSFPPDVMGDVGPTQYIVAVNGRIVTFNKTTGAGDAVLNADMDVFFNPVRNGSFTSDPRIRYDRLSGRWFVIIINVASTNNRVLFAVSSTGTITGATVWTYFFLQQNLVAPAGNTGHFADYPTLGLDANALYIGLNMFNGSAFYNTTAFVVRKSSITGAGPIVATAFRSLMSGGAGPYTPQGVDNFDPGATEGYLIGVDGAVFGRLMMRRIANPGGTPTISGNLAITVPATLAPQNVRHLGNTGGTNGLLSAVDDRLFQAIIRNGRLWTAHTVSVNNAGAVAGTPTRNAARWYEIQNLTTTPALVQSGTVYTATGTNTVDERNYWFPSVNISGQGHVAMGFSAAGTSERANAGTVGRLADDPSGTMQTPVIYTTSATAYNPPSDPGDPSTGRRWGDYSYTSVDPNDDMTMWTVQEFCNATNSYGVRVVQLIAPPPATPASMSPPSIPEGLPSVIVTLTGTQVSGSGFFDPGAGFPNHLAASVTGGVTVNSAVYVNPTTVTLNLNTVGAPLGSKDVSVTNPDGQNRSGAGILTVVTSTATLSLIAPDGGETWAVGGAQSIQWSSTGLSGNVKIELSRDGGITFPEVLFASTPDDGSQSWTVTGPSDSTVRVRISSLLAPSVADTSASDIIILQPSITVVGANGGEIWRRDSTQLIAWTTLDVPGTLTATLSRNGGATFPETLFTALANDGSEAWVVTGPGTTAARLRIASDTFPAAADTSNANFTIAVPTLTLLTPNGGDTLLIDSTAAVQWSSAYFADSVLVELSRDGGSTYAFLAGSPNDGTESVIIPAPGTTQGKIRVSAAADSTVADAGDGLFTIGKRVELVSFLEWNLLSVPVTVGDQRRTVLFPGSSSQAYAFDPLLGYTLRDTMQYGVGHWLKFPSAQIVKLFGLPRLVDTIAVSAGWNMIGSVSGPVSTDSIGQNPPGLVASQFYGYGGPGAGYETSTTIQPMRAYWVKASQDGHLILREPVAPLPALRARRLPVKR
jgi:hypothetical protein